MGQSAERDYRVKRLEQTLRLYRVAIFLCLVLLVILTSALAAGRRHRIATAIRVDGQTVCVVANKKAAEQARANLLAPLQAKWQVTPVFREVWDTQDAVANDMEVLTPREASEQLHPRLTPLLPAVSIVVEGRAALNLPDRDLAQKTLEAVKARFLSTGEKLIEQKFRSHLELVDVQVPPGEVTTDVAAAAQALLAGGERKRTYTIRPGDTLERLGRIIGLAPDQLVAREPALRQGVHAGEKIAVSYRVPGLIVVTTREAVVERPYSVPPEKVPTAALAVGETRQVTPGQPGKKRVTEKRLYENDKLVRAIPLKGVILEPAQPGRVMVGQRSGPALTPAPR